MLLYQLVELKLSTYQESVHICLEEVMSNRGLLTQQKPGTKNFLILGKYERSLDKLIISVQLIDIATWDEVDSRRITGYWETSYF
jgi:hypothetical protein